MPSTKGLAPGVYVQDVKPLLRPYESASISNLAMISQASLFLNGAFKIENVKAIRLTSYDDFDHACGEVTESPSSVSDAVMRSTPSRAVPMSIGWRLLEPSSAPPSSGPQKSRVSVRFLASPSTRSTRCVP